MSIAPRLTLEDAIRRSGEEWLIESFAPRTEAMNHIRRTLARVNQVAQQHQLVDDAPDMSEAAIVEEFERNPQKVRGFFQALGGTRTPQMLLMVWRIIQGMEVKEVDLKYRRHEPFELRVVLESPHGGEDQPYESSNIFDFALFRHIGTHEISGQPVFDGFYPLRIRGLA